MRLGLPDLAARARQLRAIVEGYELSREQRLGVVEAMIEIAIRSAAQEAIDAGVTPTSTSPLSAGRLGGGPALAGHDLLWAMTWRTRAAAWMTRHRAVLERALV